MQQRLPEIGSPAKTTKRQRVKFVLVVGEGYKTVYFREATLASPHCLPESNQDKLEPAPDDTIWAGPKSTTIKWIRRGMRSVYLMTGSDRWRKKPWIIAFVVVATMPKFWNVFPKFWASLETGLIKERNEAYVVYLEVKLVVIVMGL